MRNAETILSIIRDDYGKRGQPLENIYRLLYNKDLYLKAYAKLYPNKGAMTKGVTSETVDGMALQVIDTIIEAVRYERYQWKPVRGTYIPKANGKKRPLGIPTWGDKLLQEVIRSILEAYYEPQFSPSTHGFRPERGCHTALQDIQNTWTGTKWFIEGDIAQYFDTIDHDVLMKILGEKIHDNRFLRLIRQLLEAGYMEDWKLHRTWSGTPQGGVISPILSNIYLSKFDEYVEKVLIPAYTNGERRAGNAEYNAIKSKICYWKQRGDKERVKALRKQLQKLPSKNPNDPEYRRLRYIRYADDFLLGFVGPRTEAEEIKCQIGEYLSNELHIKLSLEKTLITNATNDTARFLGYEIMCQHGDTKHTNNRRCVNGAVGLRVPHDVVVKHCTKYMQQGKPIHRAERRGDSDYSIVAQYQQEYRGIVQYYQYAQNIASLSKLRWVMQVSLLKTLATKHKTTVNAMVAKYESTIQTPDGKFRKCLEVRVAREGKPPLIARFGGIPLQRQPFAVLRDQLPRPINKRTELLERLLANVCEICEATDDIEVHHIKKLANLVSGRGGRKLPEWKRYMIARQRKTMVVCRTCHVTIHNGTIDKRMAAIGRTWKELLESRVP